jgi:hypothetical protein
MAKLLMDRKVRQSVIVAPIEKGKQRRWRERLVDLFGERHRGVRLAVAAVAMPALVIAVVAAFLLVQNHSLRRELGQLQSQQNALQHHIDQLEQQMRVSSIGENIVEPATISALLVPGLPREPGQQNTSGALRIPATASRVLLMLDLQRDEYREYRVVIETPEGNPVSHAERLTSQTGKNGGRIVCVRLAAEALKQGDYVIMLSGQRAHGRFEVVDSYSLSVIR